MEPHWLFDEDAHDERFTKKEIIPDYDPDNIEFHMEVIEDGKKRKSLS
jgi:hypothetical protein